MKKRKKTDNKKSGERNKKKWEDTDEKSETERECERELGERNREGKRWTN